MNYRRREFLRLTAGLASGVTLTSLGCKLMSKDEEKKGDTKTVSPYNKALESFGIQLWTLRDDMPRDPKGVLQQLASFGYNHIESFEHEMGIFWKMEPADFKKYLDDIGMKCHASHCNYNKDFEKKVEGAATVGMKYLIAPWLGAQPTIDDYKKKAEEFNKAGEICKKAGLRFAYHNHDYSFRPVNNIFPQDVMMENTDPALVDYEMDMYWVVTANQDPVEWLKKYPNRWKLSHVKDRMKDAPATEGNASCDLGAGKIDYQKILHEASAVGMEYYIVEQERYDNTTPLQSAERNAQYMKNLKI